MSGFTIVPYTSGHEKLWDNFVLNFSVNGSIFHTRNFLNYHSLNKFDDCSLLIYLNDTLISVFPCCKEGNTVISHKGSSAGGPVIHKKFYRYNFIFEILKLVENHFLDFNITIKLAESVFFTVNNDALVYYFMNNGYNVKPELGSCKFLTSEIRSGIPRSLTRNRIQKIMDGDIQFYTATKPEHYQSYYAILCNNLKKYNTKPTHSLDEILVLREKLGDRQVLYLAKDQNETILTGVWIIKATNTCWHTQYISKNYAYEIKGLVEATLYLCFEMAYKNGASCVNLGISTENNGAYCNQSLLSFKEALGTVHTNRYILRLNRALDCP